MFRRGDRSQQPLVDREPQRQSATQIDAALEYLYIPVYGFSLITVALGSYLYFVPQATTDYFRYLTSSGIVACGTVMMMNNDLVVHVIRYMVQLRIMDRNNSELESNVQEQADQVRKLRKIKSGLDALQKVFAQNLDRADKEIEALEANTASKIRKTASQLVKWYLDSNDDGVISKGEEQEDAEAMVGDFFKKAISDYDARHQHFHQALNMNRTYQELNGIPTDKFSLLISAMLAKDRNDVEYMQVEVNQILDPLKHDVKQLRTQKSKAAETRRIQAHAAALANATTAAASATTAAVTRIIPRSLIGAAKDDQIERSDPFTLKVHVALWIAAMVLTAFVALAGSSKGAL